MAALVRMQAKLSALELGRKQAQEEREKTRQLQREREKEIEGEIETHYTRRYFDHRQVC